MSATIARITGDLAVAIWSGVDVYDSVTQQSAITTFLDPDSCPEGSYLVANARLQNFGQGWITIATLEWIDGVRTVTIRELGEADIVVAASESVPAITARLTALLSGTANIFPGSDYRRSR